MSATPRPWNDMTRIEQIRYRWGRSWVEITQDQDVTHDAVEDTRWLLNAFAPLLAVARLIDTHNCDCTDHSPCMEDTTRTSCMLYDAIRALDRQFPGWKEWTA